MTTTLGLNALPVSKAAAIADKTPKDYPSSGLLVFEFDIWQEGYEGSIVTVYRAGTTTRQKLFSDPQLTQEIDNPQTLITREDSERNKFGKFLTSVYVPYSYSLDIDSTEQTGVNQVPVTKLAGQDISDALSFSAPGTNYMRKLKEILATQIEFLDYGTITSNPESNTNTLNKAVSAAASAGGGFVVLPAGEIVINPVDIPEDVILQGQGIDTTIIQSTAAQIVINFSGNNAGLMNLTLDGISRNNGSIGIYGKALSDIMLENVRVRNLDTGIQWQGGENHTYTRLNIQNCDRGMLAHGDQDASGGDDGSSFTGMEWFQGSVTQTFTSGIELLVKDNFCINNVIRQVDFDSNVGTDGAVLVVGARFTHLLNCSWTNNTVNLQVEDNSDVTLDFRETRGLYLSGGTMTGGTLSFDGLCENVIIEQMNLDSPTFEANVPSRQILLRNNVETDTLFSGITTKFSRWRTSDNGVIKGATTGSSPVTVYARKLEPNEVVSLNVTATAERQNANEHAIFMVTQGAKAAPATLAYDDQTVNFTVGDEIVGQTSGARAIIVADADSGTTGTLSLAAVTGTFIDNEIIQSASTTGQARVNGVLIPPASVALSGSKTTLHSSGSNTGAPPSGWAVNFAINGQELVVQVVGAASADVVWNVDIKQVAL